MSWAEIAGDFQKIPGLTRVSLGTAILIAVPSFFNLLSVYKFCFDWPSITGKLQVYRIYSSIWIPFQLNDPLRWLFELFMLYRHLRPLEEITYHQRAPDMVWQFSLMTPIIMALSVRLRFHTFWNPFLGFVVYLSSRVSPNECLSIFGLFNLNARWVPYVLLTLDFVVNPHGGRGTIAGLLVAQVLFMLEYQPSKETSTEPRLRQRRLLQAPKWFGGLLIKPEVQHAYYRRGDVPRGGVNGQRKEMDMAATSVYQFKLGKGKAVQA